MLAVNTIVALAALIGGLLVARAFLPHVNLFGPRASDNLATGLLFGAAGTGPRSLYWDLLRPLLSFMGFETVPALLGGLAINILFNGLLLVGIYFMLRARLLTIPQPERAKHNIFTAAFFPSGILPRLTPKD